jgi:DNA gyrase subunit A
VTSDRNGALVGAVQVFDGDEVMLVSDQGTLVRTRVDEVSILGRNTQGVTLIRVSDKEKLVGVERICDAEEAVALVEGLEGEAPDPSSVTNTSANTDSIETKSIETNDIDSDESNTLDDNLNDNGDEE